MWITKRNKMRQNLKNAVQYLYGVGEIKKDKDIAEKLGYNKSTVSSYVSGRTDPSRDFVELFEKTFKIKLSDFAVGGAKEIIVKEDPLQLFAESLLQVKAYARVNQSLLVEILAHQTGKTVMELHRVIASAMDAELKAIAHELKQGE